MSLPVYYPFFKSAVRNSVEFVNSNLIYKNNRYEIDFDDFEKKQRNRQLKCFICAALKIREEGYGQGKSLLNWDVYVLTIMYL